jgi:hypothetical protein
MYEYQESQLSRHLVGELGRLSASLETGEFSGQGPGQVDEWRQGGARVVMERSAQSAANRAPEEPALPWSYTRLEFAGAITGNFQDRYGVFQERVKVLYAPVERAMAPFSRQDLSRDTKSAAGAVWMGCDTLQVMLMGGEVAEAAATIQAEGRVLVEGRSFHAAAHQLSFEESKELFVLRGRGNELASVYFERRPGDASADADRFTARVIECIPSKRDVKVDGAAGFSGAP